MTKRKSIYRTSFSLIIAFIVLLSAILIVALLITFGLSRKYVENEFYSKKLEVLEQTLIPYNDFFQNKIPEITAYQGFLNKSSASKYAATVFDTYPFVKAIDFYHFNLSNNNHKPFFIGTLNLKIALKSVYRFKPAAARKTRKMTIENIGEMATKTSDDFKLMASKLMGFVQAYDTSKVYSPDEMFNTFYDLKPLKISYINIPRFEELKVYKDLITNKVPSSRYQQDMMIFYLDPMKLAINNKHPELYQLINVRQVVYDPLENNDSGNLTTEIALPGPFSDYKLYFQSEQNYVTTGIIERFLPIAAVVLLIYLCVLVIGWLIYRNLNINHKLYKLQYDFINNFTHEFKTPVSVIKIAGSNLRSDTDLTERQRKHYGKILDEEAEKLNELMNRLLSFTQLENKSISLKIEEIDLDDFVQKYINTFSIKYPDFKLSYEIKNVKTFNSDPVLLGSIFQNLIENAYKYSPPQRKEQLILIERNKKDLILTFTDKGIGIAKKDIENVFKKFYRIESQYNQNGSVGLGLAFCKELVNFMKGEISVKSKVGEGSEFKIVLPY